MHNFTFDEINLLFLYYADNRTEQIANLEEMRGYLRDYETDLMQMTDNTLTKLRGMSDEEFAEFRSSASFDLDALGRV